MYAIANGNHSVSEIGKFTGFAYNKCDNYLSALISCGFVRADKTTSKRGADKTAYILSNSYFRLWYLYVYMNQTEIKLENRETVSNIIEVITGKEIHEYHLEKAFMLANERMKHYRLWESLRIKEKVIYCPESVSKGNFSYTFDAIARNVNKAVFIKVFAEANENCKKAELEKIRKAVMSVNTYYDSHIFIFSKRRFSDYAASEAANDDSLTLVEVDRLRI